MSSPGEKIIKYAMKAPWSGELNRAGEVEETDTTRLRSAMKMRWSGDLDRRNEAEEPGISHSRPPVRTRWSGELIRGGEDSGRMFSRHGSRTQFSGELEVVRGDGQHVVAVSPLTEVSSNKQYGKAVISPQDRMEQHSLDEEQLVEVTLDLEKNSVTLRSMTQASGGASSPLDSSNLIDGHEKKLNSVRQLSGRHSTSFRVKQLTEELKRLTRTSSRAVSNNPQEAYPLVSSLSNSSNGSHPSVQGTRRPLVRTISCAEHAIEGLRFINKATGTATGTADQGSQWEVVKARFEKLCDAKRMLHRSNFAECIGMKESAEFVKEMFDALTRRQGLKLDSISEDELYGYWVQISDSSFDARMQIFFDLCDKNADGRISEAEIKEVIMLSAAANKLAKVQEQAEEYAALIMEELDRDNQGCIELWQLETLMRGPVGGFANKEAYLQYSQSLAPQRTKTFFQDITGTTRYFLNDNWKRIWVLILWLAVMAGLSSWKFLQYKRRAAFLVMGYCLPVAKGAAETLKLNMAIILLPVCRNTITWLRSTKVGKVIPFDDNLNFHKVIATAIGIAIIIHGTLHLTCDFPRIVNASDGMFEKSVGDDFHYHQPSYGWFFISVEGITGIIMVILMSISFCLATKWFRRSLIKLPGPLHRLTGFNAFWYSHHLFVIVYILLIVHGVCLIFTHGWTQKTTWMYLAVPLLLYGGERILRSIRAGQYKVAVVKAAIYPGNVLALHFTKPPGFKYKSGMYMFLKCPEISPFEWHPFSITSAPSDAYLSVHIRTLGDWTREMKRLFSEACGGKKRMQTINNWGLSGELVQNATFPKLSIDGPYGAPAQDYRNYDVLLLVGLGIGATPFISILKDMLNRMREESQLNFELEAVPASPARIGNALSGSPIRKPRKHGTTKGYFYWVTREQASFDWFRGVMKEVEEIDLKAVIEMHNYLTSVYEEGDARSALLMMVQALHHAKNGVDFVSGTRARTHFARPNWKKVFSRLAATHRDKRVGVFYCGPAVLASELRELSKKYSQKSTTKFEFHKENF